MTKSVKLLLVVEEICNLFITFILSYGVLLQD